MTSLAYQTIDFDRFSNFNRLINSTMYVFKFIWTLRNRMTNKKSNNLNTTRNEYEHALTTLIYLAQKQSFAQEFNDLTNQKQISKK